MVHNDVAIRIDPDSGAYTYIKAKFADKIESNKGVYHCPGKMLNGKICLQELVLVRRQEGSSFFRVLNAHCPGCPLDESGRSKKKTFDNGGEDFDLIIFAKRNTKDPQQSLKLIPKVKSVDETGKKVEFEFVDERDIEISMKSASNIKQLANICYGLDDDDYYGIYSVGDIFISSRNCERYYDCKMIPNICLIEIARCRLPESVRVDYSTMTWGCIRGINNKTIYIILKTTKDKRSEVMDKMEINNGSRDDKYVILCDDWHKYNAPENIICFIGTIKNPRKQIIKANGIENF